MANRYVRKSGSDANGGTSPADAWLTVGKALSTVASGDVTYIGAGVYRENLVPPNSFTSMTRFVGDIDGAFTGDYGDVVVSGYLSGDTSLPSPSFTVSIVSKNFISLEHLIIIPGSANPACNIGTLSHDISFVDCIIIASGGPAATMLSFAPSANVQGNYTVDRCTIISSSANDAIRLTLPTSASADYTVASVIKNCVILAFNGNGIQVVPSGALAFRGGGVRVDNCTILGGSQSGVWANGTTATLSAAFPIEVYGCLLYGSQLALRANALTVLIEDRNIISSNTPRTNVAVGPNSISNNSYAVLVETLQSLKTGRGARPFFAPMLGSPLLGFGAQAGAPNIDFLGRARPGSPAVGAFELPPVYPALGRGRIVGGS